MGQGWRRPHEHLVMNADGSGVRRLTHGRDDRAPAWSPDGTRITFASSAGGIAVINVDGSRLRQLTRLDSGGPEGLHSSAWSPDSRSIAFSRCCFEETLTEPYYPDGKGDLSDQCRRKRAARLLERGHLEGQVDLTWSPDGRWIALAAHNYLDRPYDHEVCQSIYLVRSDGENTRRVTRCTSRDDDAYSWVGDASNPSWGVTGREP